MKRPTCFYCCFPFIVPHSAFIILFCSSFRVHRPSLFSRSPLGNDNVLPRDDERELAWRDEVDFVRSSARVLRRGGGLAHRLRISEPGDCHAVVQRGLTAVVN